MWVVGVGVPGPLMVFYQDRRLLVGWTGPYALAVEHLGRRLDCKS